MSDLAETGANIARLRKARGISQLQAALAANLSCSRWQQIESGCQNTTVDTLCRMADVLGVAPLSLGLLSWKDEEILSAIRFSLPAAPPMQPFQLGKNIVLLRNAQGLSQRELAKRAQVSAARLRDVERGCANASVAFLTRVAEALGISLLALGALGLSESQVLDMARQARAILAMEAA